MYLLSSQEFANLASRDPARSIFQWLETTRPALNELFVSAISIGLLAAAVETMPPAERGPWRRLLAQARRQFEQAGAIIDVDLGIVDVWASQLHLLDLFVEDVADDGPVQVGEDERLVIATAIARQYSYVSAPRPYLEQIAETTTLSVVEP